METPDVRQWIEDVKQGPDADSVGMMLIHEGVVRGTSRSGARVTGMDLVVDRARLDGAVAQARSWKGVVVARAWVNEGALAVGDPIMQVLVAGDIRENVFGALQRLVGILKTEVVSESETRS